MAARLTTRCAATSKPDVSKICEPMCECSPAKCSAGAARTAATARAAEPSRSEKPNFWSSCAVAMNSWVCASTPTVTRTSTRCRTSAAAATALSRSISSNESSTTCPTRASTPRVSSATDLLLPCMPMRLAGKPAASATASSPPVQTSRPRPSSAIQRADRGAEERLARVVDVHAGERAGVGAGPGAQVVLVQEERRGAVLRDELGHRDAAEGAARRRPGRPSRARSPGRWRCCPPAGSAAARRAARRRAAAPPGGRCGSRTASLRSARGKQAAAPIIRSASLAHHIRSGALTPSSRSPFASTTRVASLTQARVRLAAVISASPLGTMRHSSVSYQRW